MCTDVLLTRINTERIPAVMIDGKLKICAFSEMKHKSGMFITRIIPNVQIDLTQKKRNLKIRT